MLKVPKKTGKQAKANITNMLKVFTVPERKSSTLSKIELEISRNLDGFLKQTITAGDLSPADLEDTFTDTFINDDPIFVSEQADFLLKKVVAQSVHTSSPSFVGHMTSSLPYFMLPLAKIMFALNQNLVKIETSKAFTPLERQVLGMLHRLIYQSSDSFYRRHVQSPNSALGAFCSGGTIANLTALWVARNQFLRPSIGFGGIKQLGLAGALHKKGLRGLAVLMSKRAHYSLKKTVDVLGLGERFLIRIPTDSSQKMDMEYLAKEAHKLSEAKIGILAVIGVAGATETGSIDELDKIAAFCKKRKIFFHVDAAWGGPTLFSSQHRNLLAGIEKADSVTFDAHKQLYVPVGAGMVLFKDPYSLNEIEHSAAYIIRQGSRDLGKHTLEGSRQGMAMLVHSSLRIIGRKGFEILINLGISKAHTFSQMIKSSSEFELLLEPELNLVNYRYVPPKLKALLAKDAHTQTLINDYLNKLTIAIQKEQRAAGKTFVSRTTLEFSQYPGQDITIFRVVLANPLTNEIILKKVLNEQRKIAKTLLAQKEYKLPIFKEN